MGKIARLGPVPIYLALCLILGGASAAGFWANMGLQLLALPIICASLLARRGAPTSSAGRQLLIIAALIPLIILIQLIPLPPSIWTTLPGRGAVAEGFQLLGLPLPWLPISLAPVHTVASGLWLLPAAAILLGVIRWGRFSSTWIAGAIVIVTMAAVPLGALQILGGPKSQWEFYEITNFGSATGFFANSNHMATLLLVSAPFLAALYVRAVQSSRSTQRTSAFLVILAGAAGVLVVGLLINGSLAGMGLSVPVLAASFLLIVSRKRNIRWWWVGLLGLLGAGAVYVVFTGPFGNNLVGTEAQSEGSRAESFGTTAEAARDFMPVGSGVGSFPFIYRSYEDPQAVGPVYMNHAHNDYIELALETGLVGIAVLLIFLIWWVTRTVVIWRSQDPDYFAKAATIASGAILAHSTVDYPLRTAALSAVLAACCALMAEPRSRVSKSSSKRQTKAAPVRHLSAD